MRNDGRQQYYYRLDSLSDDGEGDFIFLCRPLDQIQGIDEFHDCAYSRIKMKAVLDIAGHLSDCLVGFSSQVLQIAFECLASTRGFNSLDVIEVVHHNPPCPVEKTERPLDSLITP